MKGKRIIAGILLVGILATTLAGCKNDSSSKKETEKPVITLGSDSYPPYNYLNEDGVPTGIDVELATEAFKRMGYQVEVVQINWEKNKELVVKSTSIFRSRQSVPEYRFGSLMCLDAVDLCSQIIRKSSLSTLTLEKN